MKKATRLTSHFAAMCFVVQSPGNWVVPGELLGQSGEVFAPGSMEEGGQTSFSHWEVPLGGYHVHQDRDRHGVQHNRLQRFHHVE